MLVFYLGYDIVNSVCIHRCYPYIILFYAGCQYVKLGYHMFLFHFISTSYSYIWVIIKSMIIIPISAGFI